MNWRNVRLIFAREVRDQLRDRRTLFMIAVLPLLLYPLLGMSFFQISQFLREHPTKVLVVGAPEVAGVPPLLDGKRFALKLFDDDEAEQRLLEVDSRGAKSAAKDAKPADGNLAAKELPAGDAEEIKNRARRSMQEEDFDVVVYFPPNFAQRLNAFRERLKAHAAEGQKLDQEVPAVEILSNKAREKSTIGYRRVSEVLGRWREEVGRQNLRDSDMPTTAARPFELPPTIDVAEPGQQKAAIWAKMLPFLLFLWALTGAFYPAIDLCAGEKERGTLETLLSSPAERSEIVWGKLLTVMLFSMATAVLNLASMGITGSLVLSQLPNLGPPPLAAFAWLFVALVPMSALFSALCLALAVFARSSKEGQYYLMPLVLITMPLTILPMSPGVELTAGNSLIPITGMVLLLRTVLEGEYAQALPYVPVVAGVTILCCLLAVRWAADQFNTESVLFRESEHWDLSLWFKHLLRDREDTPSVSEAVFCGVLILMIRFFMNFAMSMPQSLVVLVMFTQLVVILTPALMMTVMLTRSPPKTLLLRMPPLLALPAAAALAVTIHPVLRGLGDLVMKLYPMNEHLEEQLKKFSVGTESTWLLVLVIAVAPAICEELAFRGFILSGLRHMGHKWRAIAVSSLFFGISHAIFQQSVVACLMGAVIGFVAVQTGSIFPGMVFHMLNNSLALLGSQEWNAIKAGSLERFGPHVAGWLDYLVGAGNKGEVVYRWPLFVLGAITSAALLFWFRNLTYARSPEESLQEAIQQHTVQSVAS